MALTAEQQQQLAQLRAEQDGPSIGPSNPQARRVEVPPVGSDLMYRQAQADDKKFQDAHQGDPSIPSPDEQTPAQRGVFNARMGAVAGSQLPAPPAVTNAAKWAAGKLSGIGGYLAGLTPAQVETYAAAPNTVEALAAASPARQVRFSNAATSSVSNRLSDRNQELESGLQGFLQGKSVPRSSIPSEAMDYFNKDAQQSAVSTPTGVTQEVTRTQPQTHNASMVQTNSSNPPSAYDMSGASIGQEAKAPDTVQISAPRSWSENVDTGTTVSVPSTSLKLQDDPISGQGVPAQDLLRSVRQAGEDAKFSDNPITPFGDRARAQQAGKAFSGGRQALSNAYPEVDPILNAKQQGIEAQQSLRPGPGQLESESTNPAANRENAQKLVGSTRLTRSADQLQTAQQLQEVPSTLRGRATKYVGKGLLSGNVNPDPLAQYLTRPATAAMTSERMPNDQDQQAAPGPTLPPDKQALLNQLRQEQGQ